MGQLPPLCGQHGNAQALGAYAEGTHDAQQIASLPDLQHSEATLASIRQFEAGSSVPIGDVVESF